MDDQDGVETIRDTPFGQCVGARILDITSGEGDDEFKVYFHLDNGQTFFATVGNEDSPCLMGFVSMDDAN